MSNLTTSARLADPVRDEYLGIEEEPDWRDRGSKSELTSQLWHGEDGDFGALTRFGMGWGAVEVQRTSRTVTAGGRLRRVLTVLLGGKAALRVTATDEHLDDVTILDEDVADPETPGTATTVNTVAPAHARYDERRHTQDDVTPPLDGYVDESDARLLHLQQLSETIQTLLTPARRKSKYIPAAVLTMVDEMHDLLKKTS